MFDWNARTNIQLPDNFTVSDVLGITDFGRPSQSEQRSLLRGTFEACVRRRAHRFASSLLPSKQGPGLTVERRTAEGWEEVEPDHPWMQLIRTPNEHRSPYVYWKWVSMARDLQGRASQLVRDDARGMPEALLEIFAEFGYVEPLASRDGGVDGYVYQRADGQEIRLEARDVMELKRTDPHSPYETQSLLESLALEVAGDKFATQYRRNAFESGRPPMVSLTTDQEMNKSQAQEFGQTFKKAFMDRRGNIAGIPVLPNGLELNEISLDPESFQMLEAQGLDQSVIFRVTGVPQALLDMGSNRAESEEARQEFLRGTIQPMLVEAAAQLTQGLRRAFQPEGELRVMAPDVTPVDRREQAETDKVQIETGTATLNELRQRDGKEPYETDVADEPLIPNSLVPASQAGMAGATSQNSEIGDFL